MAIRIKYLFTFGLLNGEKLLDRNKRERERERKIKGKEKTIEAGFILTTYCVRYPRAVPF